MNRIAVLFIVFSALFYSCNNNQESDLNLQHINKIAETINNDLKSIRDEMVVLTNTIQYKIPFDNSVVWDTNQNYTYKTNEVLSSLYLNNNSAVYFPANFKITNDLKKTIVNSEILDTFFIEIMKRNLILAQIYFLDTNSFLRIYPFIDVAKYLENDIDLTQLISYQSTHHKPFIDHGAYWVNQPFADPYGRGWIISCVEPVYFHDQFLGIVSGDIPLRAIKIKYFSSSNEMMILTNKDGMLIYGTKESFNITHITPYRDFQYFKKVSDDIFIFNNSSLTEHSDKNIRTAFKSLLSGEVKEDFYMGTKRYTIYKSLISEINWYLFKIIN